MAHSSITAVIGVGVGVAGLIWQLQRETSKRIENLEFRMQSVETGLAELKGFIIGLTVNAPNKMNSVRNESFTPYGEIAHRRSAGLSRCNVM